MHLRWKAWRRRSFPYWLFVLFLGGLVSCYSPPMKSHRLIGRDLSWEGIAVGQREKAVTAFVDDLVVEIGKQAEFTVHFGEASRAVLRQQLKQGTIEAMMSSLPPLAEFRDEYDFSKVCLYAGPVLVVRNDSSILSMKELKGKVVGVQRNSSALVLAGQVPEVVLRRYPNDRHALQALAKEEVDGVLVPALIAYAYVRDLYAGLLKIVTPPLTNQGIRLVVLKGKHHDLLEGFNQGLKEVVDQGIYDRLQIQWGLDLGEGAQREPVCNPKEDEKTEEREKPKERKEAEKKETERKEAEKKETERKTRRKPGKTMEEQECLPEKG